MGFSALRDFLRGATIALASVAAALLLRWLLDPVLGNDYPLVTLFGTVAIAVWAGGVSIAVIAAVLGYLGCAYFFIEPRGDISLVTANNLVGLAAYLLTCSIIIGFGEAMRRAQKRSQAAEESAHRQRETLRITLESIGDAVITTDTRGRVTFLNDVARQLTGWDPEAAANQPLTSVFQIINESTRKVVDSPVDKVLADGRVVALANHTVLIDRTGGEHPIDDSAAPIRDAQGQLVGVVLVFRDVAVQRRAEHALRESEARARAVLDSALDCIITCDHSGTILEFNPAAERTFGYRREDMLGKEVSAIVPSSHRARHQEGMARLARTGEARIVGQRLHMPALCADGREIAVEMAITAIPVQGPPVFTAFLRDISARQAMEDELRNVAAALAESDRRKTEFLAVLAHELRNPLAPLRNALELLKKTPELAPHTADLRDMMERQVRLMVRLVDDLLDVSRISRDKIEFRPERTSLNGIVQDAVESSGPQFTALNQELAVELPESDIYLDADAPRLTQVVGNLLNNAAKFTPPGGRVRLTVTGDRQAAVITVQDNGIGIPAQDCQRIFDLFAQLDTSLARNQSGLGIGLTLVKKLVEMHGGTVEAASGGPGQGATFTVRLPIGLGVGAVPANVERMAQNSAIAPRRILVVDDNVDSASSLATLLQLGGHDVRLAYDGIEALGIAVDFLPDVVLLDIGLPQLNGYEVAQRLRSQRPANHLLLVAITGWGSPDDRVRSEQAGFNAHLVKPVELEQLERLIDLAPREERALSD